MRLKEQKIGEITEYQDKFRDQFAEVLKEKDWLQIEFDLIKGFSYSFTKKRKEVMKDLGEVIRAFGMDTQKELQL
jgi:hypothetical protein